MFTAGKIREIVTAQPFKPFRICMSDGRAFEVRHHDSVIVTQNTIEVGIGVDDAGIAENVSRCAILHITGIEDLQPA
jgi:hypothetical protein